MRTLRLLPFLIFSLACAGLGTPEPEPVSEPAAGFAPAVADAPEPPAAPAPAPTGLPEAAYGSLPGWLVWTTAPEGKGTAWNVPASDFEAVLFDAEAWDAVKAGKKLELIAQEGSFPATFGGVFQVPLGCDGTPHGSATFDVEEKLAPQVAWLLPEGAKAASLEVTAEIREPQKVTWKAGPFTVTTRVESPTKGRFEVFRDAEVLQDRAWTVSLMEGAEPEPIDLAADLMWPGVPVPEAVFQLEDGTFILVVRVLSMEGVHWEVFSYRKSLAQAGDAYLYLCAN